MPAGFGLVVNERNEILMIQRGYGKEKGQWSLPGGNMDRGESLRKTAVRETREETGIKMTADDLYYKSERHRFEIWRGKRIGGRLKIQRKECLDAAWLSNDMLPHDDNLAFGPDKRAIGKWADENPGSRRVHYPRRKMVRAGFGLVLNEGKGILLIRRKSGRRAGKWSLPGGNAERGKSRRSAAVYWTRQATGIEFTPERLYYENRHDAQIWLGRLPARSPREFSGPWFDGRRLTLPTRKVPRKVSGRWFPLHQLPDDDSLAFAIDVRTIKKWAAENSGSSRISYSG